MKIVTVLFLFSFTNSWGQATLPLSRTTWGGAEPTGWTNSGCTQRTTSFACTGSDGTIFDTNGDSRMVFFSSAPDQLVFKLKKSSMSGESSLLVQESPDGSIWTNIGNYGTATGATAITDCGNITITLNCLSRYVKWTYTKATGNCDMDDVSVSSYTGTCGSSNTITTGAVATSPFVLATCASTVSGTVDFTSVGTFSTGNIYTAQLSNAAGSFTSAVNIGTLSSTSNSGTITITIPAGTASGTGYLIRVVANNPNTTGSNSAAFTITQNGAVQPTTQASSSVANNLGCNSFILNWVVGNGSNRLIVVRAGAAPTGPSDLTSYTANNTYASGTALGGGFVVYSGTGNSVFVNGLSASTAYHWAIYEFNGSGACTNYLTSTASTGNVTTTACSAAAGITAVYIDACAGGCGFEGNNELIWANSGSYGFEVSTNGPMLHYNSTSPPTSTMISTYTTNASNLVTLNNADGACGTTTFIDPNTQGYIPPYSTFLIANNCMCSPSSYDFSGLCGSGPIYVVFGTNAAWPCNSTGGIFGNKNCSGTGVDPRFFDLDFTAWGVSMAPIYSYTPCALIGGVDGDIVLTNPSGGPAHTYSNSACVVPPIVLPIELIDFYGTQNGSVNNLVWKVASEKNVSHYIIEKSEDGINFSEMTRINAIGDEGNLLTYTCDDSDPFNGITYYRLGTMETNQAIIHHKIVDLDRGNKDWKSLIYQENEELMVEWKNYVPKDATVLLFDLSGKQLVEKNSLQAQTRIKTKDFASGIYFVKILTPYKTENFKIVIQR